MKFYYIAFLLFMMTGCVNRLSTELSIPEDGVVKVFRPEVVSIGFNVVKPDFYDQDVAIKDAPFLYDDVDLVESIGKRKADEHNRDTMLNYYFKCAWFSDDRDSKNTDVKVKFVLVDVHETRASRNGEVNKYYVLKIE